MRKNSRLLGAAVVGAAAVIAACLGTSTFSTSEQQVVSFSSNPVFVGTVMAGGTVTSAPITISPQTSGDNDSIVSIAESPNCPDFSLNLPAPVGSGGSAHIYCDGGGYGTGATGSGVGGETYGGSACVPVSYSFTATFSPTAAGPASCLVNVVTTPYGGGSSTTYQLTLNGMANLPPYAATTTPGNGSTINFGGIPLNTTSSTQRVSITNTGSSALTVNVANSNSGTFGVAGVSGAALTNHAVAAGGTAAYDLTCTPTTASAHTGTLTITSTQGSITRSFNLACTGINTTLVINPSPIAFASDAIVGVAPAEIVVGIINTASAPTTLTNVSIDPNMASGEVTIVGTNPQGTTIGSGGGSATVRLRYSAATARAYGKLDSLVIAHSSGAPRDVTINGGALEAEIGASPALVDFGAVCAGKTVTQDAMVYASGAGDVSFDALVAPSAPFSATATTGKLTANPRNTILVKASVTPTAAGVVEGAIGLDTNLPGAAREIKLKVTGLPAGVTPTPSLVYFGPGQVGAVSKAKTIELTNCGSTPIAITSARVEGPSAADFAIVSELPQAPVGETSSTTFDLIMTPRTNGLKRAQLVIEYEGGVATVDLDGNGFGGDEDEILDRETYYKCSAGGGAGGLAPLAFALLLLRRRRK